MQKIIDFLSDSLTKWVGSTSSLLAHTVFFLSCFSAHFLFGWDITTILLVLTTLVSLEAIYLAIFIQRSVNQQSGRLHEMKSTLHEFDDSLDHVEEALDQVEEGLEDLGESLEDVEEGLEDVEEALDEHTKNNRKMNKGRASATNQDEIAYILKELKGIIDEHQKGKNNKK